ncbi:MAG: hypothetical protein KGJ33_00505 [Patescibacteria group bacterium]|nr:hypothetical protein [Patescibacteria group bacterium]
MNSKTTPKDFFLHLAAAIFLYTAVVAMINLAFSIVNRAMPDQLQMVYGVSDIVWPTSILIVLVPVMYVLEWLISRDIARTPEKKGIWIRRWRIHLTLFLTGVTIVIDLIALINTYLNGELTGRFVYKVLIVLTVSAIIFAYYILARNNDPGRRRMWRSVLMWVGAALAIAAVIGGFVIIGSPAKQRALQFDQRRIGDLASLQSQIISYWQRTSSLPPSLQSLAGAGGYFTLPLDPETRQAYEYNLGDPTSFELCATFDLPSSANDVNGGLSNMPMPYPAGVTSVNWDHPAGHACFDRSIDTRFYPAQKTADVAPALSSPNFQNIVLTSAGGTQFSIPETMHKGLTISLQWTSDVTSKSYGNTAYICLVGLDKAHASIPLTENAPGCYLSEKIVALIATTTVTSGRYDWKVDPMVDVFASTPVSYELVVSVSDSLPPQGRSEWAGLISKSTSNEFMIQ